MFSEKKYTGLSEAQIKKKVQEFGFDPVKIANPADYTYLEHSHEETKLLVILEGSMEVTVGNKVFQCAPYDEIIIPGGEKHSAVVGSDGCIFYWSEKVFA